MRKMIKSLKSSGVLDSYLSSKVDDRNTSGIMLRSPIAVPGGQSPPPQAPYHEEIFVEPLA